MPRLSIIIDGAQIGEAELKSGVNRVGRSPANDVSISHASVSGSHCEIQVNETSVLIRDLGSTNGTYVNGESVYERELLSGQSLRVGNVELVLNGAVAVPGESVAVASTPARLGLRVAKVEPAAVVSTHFPAGPATAAAVRAYPFPKTSDLLEKGFFRSIPDSFVYPFKRDGLIALICGTAVFFVLDVLGNLPGIFSWFLAIFGFGYLAAFMQKMIVSSAQGDEDLPGLPEFSEWYSDIIHPALLVLGSFAASFGPAVVFWFYADMDPTLKLMVGLSLVVFGCFYLPMALMATAMYDSMLALNPLLIVPSMVRIVKEYFIVCVLLGIVVGVRTGLDLLLEIVIPIPILPGLISGFIGLYLLIVEMRILGLVYFFKKDELAWSF